MLVMMILMLGLGGCAGMPAQDVAATGGHSGGHSSEWDLTAMPDPCRLIDRTEVTAAVGRPAAEGRKIASWPPLCQFRLDGSTQFYLSDNERDTARQEYDQLRNSGQSVEPMTDLGDEAYWVPEVLTLHIMQGPTHLTVAFAGPGLPDVRSARTSTETVARTALSRL